MRILLVLPYDTGYHYHGRFSFSAYAPYAPLTLATLAALVPTEFRAHIDIVDEGVQRADYDHRTYDVVGITCVVSSAPRAYTLAAYWRKKGALVVLGGAHPTLMPEEAGQYADAVVIGPGEESWPQVLRDFARGSIRKFYQTTWTDELSCPIARRDLQAKRYLPVPTMVANRSCRNHCEFCAVHKFYAGNRCVRPIPEVIAEIRSLRTRRLVFLDSNLVSDRAYATQLFEALISLRLQWFGAATIDLVEDQELFALCVRSGCEGLLIGFESLSQASMDRSRKYFNQISKYKAAVNTLHDHAISVLGCFVLGFDDDTKESLQKLPELVADLEIDLPRYALLTPFPGTDLFARLQAEGRLLTEDWTWYDSGHVVFRPNQMQPDELQAIYRQVWHNTYSLSRIGRRILRLKKYRFFGLLGGLGLYRWSRLTLRELYVPKYQEA